MQNKLDVIITKEEYDKLIAIKDNKHVYERTQIRGGLYTHTEWTVFKIYTDENIVLEMDSLRARADVLESQLDTMKRNKPKWAWW